MAAPISQVFSNLKLIAIIFINILLIKAISLTKSFIAAITGQRTLTSTAQFLSYIEDNNPAIRYSKTLHPHELTERCAVCLSELKEGESVRNLKCKHLFHKGCLDEWLQQYCKSTCPLCRHEVLDNEVVASYRLFKDNENERRHDMSTDEMFFLVSSLQGHANFLSFW